MNMKTVFLWILLLVCLMPLAVLAQDNTTETDTQPGGATETEPQGEPSVVEQVQWQIGPGAGQLGELAEVDIPEGYVFAAGDDTRLLMEAMQNPVSGRELGFLAPDNLSWYLVFEYDETGHILDAEKAELDSDALLASLKEANDAGNEERKKRGWTLFQIAGWELPPQYNPTTQNLEWAIKGESEGQPVINWNTRLLGREGVMEVTLVAGPDILNDVKPQYETLIGGFDYKAGQKYAEYTKGDKVAEYGLAALIAGGATAVAAKTGVLKYLWKILLVVGIAVVAFFRRIFSRKKE
jgi:uncharacterized membrane-anchored protein